MHTFPAPVRAYQLATLLCVSLLLAPPSAVESAAPPPSIEKLSIEALNRLIADPQETLLVFFTAAWCGHCKEMLRPLNRLFHRFDDKGLNVIGVSVDAGSPAAMQAVLKEKKVDFTVYWVGEAGIDEFRLMGIPMIFLIKQGKLVEKIPGKCSYDFLEKKVLDLIK